MVGSFLMGCFGVVFKADISYRSEFLAIGLTTSYLGSVTTFSGSNQKMLEPSVEGHWVLAALGFLLGLLLAAYSITFGVETSKCFRQLLVRSSGNAIAFSRKSWRVDSHKRHMAVFAVFLLLLAGLWSMSGILIRKEFNSNSNETQLLLACIVGPLGVWLRWFLAQLNRRGLGKTGLLKWVLFGTLIANVSVACIMAALATVKKEVNTRTCDIVARGIQFGFLGCLSTVSTFIAEFNAMRDSKCPSRAYMYAIVTICSSFCLGNILYLFGQRETIKENNFVVLECSMELAEEFSTNHLQPIFVIDQIFCLSLFLFFSTVLFHILGIYLTKNPVSNRCM